MTERVYIAAVDVEEFDDTELGAAVRDAHASGVRLVVLEKPRVPVVRLRPDGPCVAA